MQLILIKPVRKWGKVGEEIKVTNGYGKHYLIRQGFAIRCTKKNRQKFLEIQKDLESNNLENKSLAEKAGKKLSEEQIKFITPSSSDGKLYGSVGARAIAKKISQIVGMNLSHNNILMQHAIKNSGVHTIEVALHPEVVIPSSVVVAKTELEASSLLSSDKNESK